jgi:5'-nucleotidase
MEKNVPLILISNDDGYHAKGFRELIGMVRDMGYVIACAPEAHRSGASCAFSPTIPLTLKLRHKEDGVEVWSCNGTPVDCVKMALAELCGRKPDIVIGGINHGDNASVNTHYSGTMGVTMEGCMKYIPSIAFSLCDHRDDADFRPLRDTVRMLTRRVLDEGLPTGVCLNVNFPLQPAFRGVRVCRMARGSWLSEVERCHHPRGYDYWWMMGHYHNDEPQSEDTDRWALDHGYVAVTPTQMDVTAYQSMEMLKSWEQ